MRGTIGRITRSPLRTVGQWGLSGLLAIAVLGACSSDSTDPTDEEERGSNVPAGGDAPTNSTLVPTGDASHDPAATPKTGGTLRFGLFADSLGFNPTVDQFNLSTYQVGIAVYDRLVAYDENDEAQPYLVEAITPNDDFTEWTFALRDGVMFHDGTEFDAEALASNLRAQKESPLLGQVFQALDTIEVADEEHVVVSMNTPWASFLHTLTAQPGTIVAQSVLDAGAGAEPVGTGAFRLVDWVQGDSITLERFEDYWRDGYPLLDRIEFSVVTEDVSRSNGLRSGEFDLIEVREGGMLLSFQDDPDYVVHLDQQGETTESVLGLNLARPPFDNPLAREAVAYALDREVISNAYSSGVSPPANGPFRAGSPWYQGIDFPGYDLERAQDAALRYEEESGEPLEVDFLVPAFGGSTALAEVVQAQLGAAGITVTLDTQEPTASIVSALSGDYEMLTTDVLFGSTHPDREYTFLRSTNALPPGDLATNFTRVQNDLIDQGLDEARASDDRAEQSTGWGLVQQGLVADSPYIFLLHEQIATVATPAVRDVTTWSFPDDTPGLAQEQNVVSLYQVWIQ